MEGQINKITLKVLISVRIKTRTQTSKLASVYLPINNWYNSKLMEEFTVESMYWMLISEIW